jgi:hypothetical protein
LVTFKVTPPRTLDFDIENRPLNYAGEDFTFSEITAIAWCFVPPQNRGKLQIDALCLGEVPFRTMLLGFLAAFVQADMVTGHNIIRHDLRILNGALLEEGLSPLPPILVSDTYADLKKKGGVSGSQANLAAMLGVKSSKVGMSQADWREANRLGPAGIEKTRRRVIGDVKQHIALRKELLRREWLRPPRLWSP